MGGWDGSKLLNDIYSTDDGTNWTWIKHCANGFYKLGSIKECVDEIKCKYVYNHLVDKENGTCSTHCGEYIHQKTCVAKCPKYGI